MQPPRRKEAILTPVHVMNSGGVPARDRRDYYLSYIESGIPGVVDIGKNRDFTVRSRDWKFPGLVCSHNQLGQNHRTTWNLSRKRRLDVGVVMVRTLIAGAIDAVFDDQPAEIRPGDTYIKDYNAQGAVFIREPAKLFSVYLPYSELDYRPSLHSRFRLVKGVSPEGLLLKAVLLAFAKAVPETKTSDGARLSRALIDTLNALLTDRRGDLDSITLAEARRAAIASHVREHIGREDLGAASICKKFGLSRATLYRDFAAFGGFERFVTNCRLDRAFQQLEESGPRRGAVREASEAWGFFDPQQFNRAFRTRYGLAPSEVTAAAQRLERRAQAPRDAGDSASWGGQLFSLHGD